MLAAVTRYRVAELAAKGVPVITQVLERLSPTGRSGEDVHEVITPPPVLEGVIVGLGLRSASVTEAGEKLIAGLRSIMVMLSTTEELPPVFEAVIV